MKYLSKILICLFLIPTFAFAQPEALLRICNEDASLRPKVKISARSFKKEEPIITDKDIRYWSCYYLTYKDIFEKCNEQQGFCDIDLYSDNEHIAFVNFSWKGSPQHPISHIGFYRNDRHSTFRVTGGNDVILIFKRHD